MKLVDFTFDEETHITYCYVKDDKGRLYIGTAMCHEEDRDMESWRTGEEIAFRRARMDYLRGQREYDIKPRLAALKHLQGCMRHSSQFNPKSYENRMLCRQIRLLEFDLATIKEELAYARKSLKEYIEGKDKIYKLIRTNKGQE